MYSAYTNEPNTDPCANLRPETQRYIDQNIIPVVKLDPGLAAGMGSYLKSQGIFEPAAISYINQHIK